MIDVKIPKHTLITYSRNKNNEPNGVIVAIPSGLNDGTFNIGYSQCRKTDKFDKKMGLSIALGRAYHISSLNMPHNLSKLLPSFITRCEKYYKIKPLRNSRSRVSSLSRWPRRSSSNNHSVDS